jgi:hypothetical protein
MSLMGGDPPRFASPRIFQLVIIALVPLPGDERTTAVQQPLYQSFLSENVPRSTM